jgi:gliding motility-associated-like protein
LTNTTTLDQTDLPAGLYTLTVTDEISCSRQWNISIDEPDSLAINPVYFEINGFRISCKGGNDGNISLNPTGGVMPYTFNWTTLNGSGLIPGNENQVNLTAGLYTVHITDANGCEAEWDLSLNEPDSLKTNIIATTISCFGINDGSADLSVQGGVPGYSYLWNTGDVTQDLDSIFMGNYTVQVTDANGCIIQDSTVITEPPEIILQLNSPPKYNGKMISCFGRSDAEVSSIVSGGRGSYRYLWLPGGDTSSSINNVPAGTYYLEVTDDNNCTVSDSFVVTQPQPLTTEVYSTDPTCFGKADGTITLLIVGGTPEYTINWNLPGQSGLTASGLISGTYPVNITDLNGCSLDTSRTLTQPEVLVITKTFAHPSCPDRYDGSIDVGADGGTPPYTFRWNTNMEGTHLEDLHEGRYILQVSDNQQCVLYDTTILKGINNSCLTIPTAFTPNGDGVNDTWEIEGMELYPDATVEIFNRWGERMFNDNHGYSNRWDGTYRGRELPIDSYHYIIDLKNGREAVTGNVTIIR